MDKKRAIEIMKSNEIIPVNYNGRSVVMNQYDEDRNLVKVFPLDNLNSEFSVELNELNEFFK
ncbi:H-type small acid-soluble spore protein [Oceanobacillus sp. Castelsardo]|uniref:H-type small acid-soluble spore protein n=1 Tax=Oceanobacillus sp. Castelsardo TaxID=1851204 RepID=UPI000839855E|nr:H-type small acid-soluble spore protein [Oceanobacillus sp. Castelsardo]